MFEFQFVGFTPREVFKDRANELAEDVAKLLPPNANSSARVVMIDSKFFFQIMVVSKTECFIAKEVLDPNKADTNSRDWQILGVERAIESLMYQVNEWRETAVA